MYKKKNLMMSITIRPKEICNGPSRLQRFTVLTTCTWNKLNFLRLNVHVAVKWNTNENPKIVSRLLNTPHAECVETECIRISKKEMRKREHEDSLTECYHLSEVCRGSRRTLECRRKWEKGSFLYAFPTALSRLRCIHSVSEGINFPPKRKTEAFAPEAFTLSSHLSILVSLFNFIFMFIEAHTHTQRLILQNIPQEKRTGHEPKESEHKGKLHYIRNIHCITCSSSTNPSKNKSFPKKNLQRKIIE
ncbi:unnamed protein product [Allacma fusca]|uniref:Uncharacterized protein n=1 Tax=Allacma fusca TaxID=39272 RepID=A0A8J2JYI3_9HEXA|nr:unnamed protein product [Allacma fusca]